MTHPSVADLLSIAPRPGAVKTTTIARVLGINWCQAAELKRLALSAPAPPPRIVNMMRELGISQAEAEAYIRLQRAHAHRSNRK